MSFVENANKYILQLPIGKWSIDFSKCSDPRSFLGILSKYQRLGIFEIELNNDRNRFMKKYDLREDNLVTEIILNEQMKALKIITKTESNTVIIAGAERSGKLRKATGLAADKKSVIIKASYVHKPEKNPFSFQDVDEATDCIIVSNIAVFSSIEWLIKAKQIDVCKVGRVPIVLPRPQLIITTTDIDGLTQFLNN